MQTFNISQDFFNLFFTNSLENFEREFALWLKSQGEDNFTLWSIKGNMCQSLPVSTSSIKSAFDIYELGYMSDNNQINETISFFDEEYYLSWSFFFGLKDYPKLALTFHNDNCEKVAKTVSKFLPYISKRVAELSTADKSIDLYVDYQKKIDFVTKAGAIFNAIEMEQVISVSLSFFAEVFSSEAVCGLYNGKFYGIGLEERHIMEDIFMSNISAYDCITNLCSTEYIENNLFSEKFNIKNVFFIYEPTINLRYALFNITSDVVPDKEFSTIVTAIVSVAVENAINHEKHTQFKIEEQEINQTVEVLNKFVPNSVNIRKDNFDIYAMNVPARETGGDFVNVKNDDDVYKFCVADVCGKGYTAAILTVVLSVLFSSRSMFTLQNFVTYLNNFLLKKNFEDKFITGFFGEFDLKSRMLTYIYCGHEPSFLIIDNNVNELTSKNIPLGIIDEDYELKEVYIPEGATLFVYTDGILEYTNYDGLIKLLQENLKYTAEETVKFLYDTLVDDKVNQKDDFTCVMMKL